MDYRLGENIKKGQKIKTACQKCGGAGWLWWYELDEYDGPAVETGDDDTRYSCACDACGLAAEGGVT